MENKTNRPTGMFGFSLVLPKEHTALAYGASVGTM